jgi:hypothetical protein
MARTHGLWRSAAVACALGALSVALLSAASCTRTVRKVVRPDRNESFQAMSSLFDGPWAAQKAGTTETTVAGPLAGEQTTLAPDQSVPPPPSTDGAAPSAVMPERVPDPNNPILATIREIESGNNYQARNSATASGAYQITDATWGFYLGYPSANVAPPPVQDTKAAELITRVLAPDDDVGRVPVAWYVGHVPADDSPEWDQVPAAYAGNRLTIRQYQTKWLALYETKIGTETVEE